MVREPRKDTRYAIRDSIHGLIRRSPKEIRVMNTGVFQRLRRIRQLAMAHLVYPGALHTRFEHSVGTMHVASEIYERLGEFIEISEDEAQVVRLAALLHDIGHGPFSHVSEYVLEQHYDREALTRLGSSGKIHEQITVQILTDNPEIAGVLSLEERQAVVALLKEPEPGKRNFKHDIISSSLDADKMDYLLRDSYFAGVRYGNFDLEKIVDACRVVESGGESLLALDHEGVYAFEQMAMAKYHMGVQVYSHRVRAITDAMLVRGVNIAIREGDAVTSAVFRYDGSSVFLERYLEYDDDRVLRTLAGSNQWKVRDLFGRLFERRLLKQICELRLQSDVANAVVRSRLAKLEPETDGARALEKPIGEALGIDPDLVIVNRWSVKNPTFHNVSGYLDVDQIKILDASHTPREPSEFADLTFASNTTAPSRESIQVYAPRDHWNDPYADTRAEREECQQAVKDILVRHVS